MQEEIEIKPEMIELKKSIIIIIFQILTLSFLSLSTNTFYAFTIGSISALIYLFFPKAIISIPIFIIISLLTIYFIDITYVHILLDGVIKSFNLIGFHYLFSFYFQKHKKRVDIFYKYLLILIIAISFFVSIVSFSYELVVDESKQTKIQETTKTKPKKILSKIISIAPETILIDSQTGVEIKTKKRLKIKASIIDNKYCFKSKSGANYCVKDSYAPNY